METLARRRIEVVTLLVFVSTFLYQGVRAEVQPEVATPTEAPRVVSRAAEIEKQVVKLLAEQRWADAILAIEAAQRKEPTPRLRLWLARVYQQCDREKEAAEAYLGVLAADSKDFTEAEQLEASARVSAWRSKIQRAALAQAEAASGEKYTPPSTWAAPTIFVTTALVGVGIILAGSFGVTCRDAEKKEFLGCLGTDLTKGAIYVLGGVVIVSGGIISLVTASRNSASSPKSAALLRSVPSPYVTERGAGLVWTVRF